MVLYDSLSKSMRNVLDYAHVTDAGDGADQSDTALDFVAATRLRGLAVYACGPTVYAPAHLGHARTYVCLDVLRRCLEHFSSAASSSLSPQPHPVFVLNITDVDDKILAAAAAATATESSSADGNNSTEESPTDLARRFEGEFWRDWDALNLLRPHVVTRVTEYVDPCIVDYIAQLLESGVAYNDGNGNVYFDVRAFETKMKPAGTHYGKLGPPSSASGVSLHSDACSDAVDEQHNDPDFPILDSSWQKRDPRDFALWKGRKPGELLYWDSPFGEGRPGWHIECSAMIHAVQSQLRDSHVFCLHAGGVDLQFPHHCNEIAQAEGFYSNRFLQEQRSPLQLSDTERQEWIPHWVHTGHLYIDGMKMSKSLKNFITIQEMLSSSTDNATMLARGDDFRWWCLSSSYRDSVTYSKNRLKQARRAREQIVQVLLDGEVWLARAEANAYAAKRLDARARNLLVAAQGASSRCLSALASDLDGPTYQKKLSKLVANAKTYIETDLSARNSPSEPLRAAVATIRNLLSLVGFSDVTSRAGLALATSSASSASHVVGGERALLDEMCRFRTAVRNLAVSGISMGNCRTPLTDILALCDDARNRVFPALGVELFDNRVVSDASPTQGYATSDDDGRAFWKYCVPRKPTSHQSMSSLTQVGKSSAVLDPLSIPLDLFFRVGPYKGQFREFEPSGLPTLMADGSPVSNRLRKKLEKKLEKQARRLEEAEKQVNPN
jgi:cysteinyl-tRNA synthetase